MPRPRRALEIFLSVGATAGVLASTISPTPALAQHQHHGAGFSAQGGEGGEGGEAGHSSAVETKLDALVVLGQMQGHLLVAQELLEQQNFKAAEPHVGHPVDELYGALAPGLQRFGVAPFLPTLEALRQQVRLNPNSPETKLKLAQAQQAIRAAAKTLDGEAAMPASLLLSVVRQLGATAAEEYSAAIAGDRVVEVIEYQDARGFLLEAIRLLAAGVASEPADAAALTAKRKTVAAMLKAFPAVSPPQKAVLSPEQLQQLQQEL
jgi:hypothetical protein